MNLTSDQLALFITALITLTLAARVVLMIRNRPQLEVLAHVAEFKPAAEGETPTPGGKHWFCKVRNIGRRAVIIESVIIDTLDSPDMWFTGNVPAVLKPGQSTEAWLAIKEITHPAISSDIMAVISTGARFRARFNARVPKEGRVEFPH